MSMSGIFAQIVALIGAAAILWRRQLQGGAHEQAVGSNPTIPAAQAAGQHSRRLKMPTARGWTQGQTPVAAPGLRVNAFATGLKHPRWIQLLPNGDVLTAEALFLPGPVKSLFDYAMVSTMKRAAAVGVSPNRITLLRDADGDGVAETRETFLEGLSQPFGMALLGDTFYVGNTDGVVAFPYATGATPHHGAGAQAASVQARRALDAQPAAEPRWAEALCRRRLAQQYRRQRHGGRRGPRRHLRDSIWPAAGAASSPAGLRNPVGLAWEPNTGALWTVVNERDGLGDETPPDYLTSVRDGGFYGWPYCYWGQTVDDRVPQDPAMVAKALTPDYALGGPHRLARPLLAARRHAARLSRRHGHRPARLLEPQQAQRLQGRLRAVRERAPRRAAARYSLGLPGAGRAGVLWPAGRRGDRPRRLPAGGRRCRRRDLAGDGRKLRLGRRSDG